MSSNSINILVVDDSAVMRTLVTDMINKEPGFQTIGVAMNGTEAARKCGQLKPDVVLMDMEMGDSDGLDGVQLIMAECPTPIIILTSMKNTEASPVMEAINAGAVDYHQKPDRTITGFDHHDELLFEKIRSAATAKLDVYQKVADTSRHKITETHTFLEATTYEIVVIGSSTGGPSAVEAIITRLPKNLNVPVVIAQHMPDNFIVSFANRLNQLTQLEVIVASKNMILKSGYIYIAPASGNLIVREDRLAGNKVFDFTSDRFKDFNNPSATGLMLSIAEVYKGKSIGVVLTGMGRDGSEGLKAIKEAGGYTIAQSKETCVVFGMPGSAIELGAITKVVPIDQIAQFVVSCLDC